MQPKRCYPRRLAVNFHEFGLRCSGPDLPTFSAARRQSSAEATSRLFCVVLADGVVDLQESCDSFGEALKTAAVPGPKTPVGRK